MKKSKQKKSKQHFRNVKIFRKINKIIKKQVNYKITEMRATFTETHYLTILMPS